MECLNSNANTINCPYSLRGFTITILLKFTDCMRWKFFKKAMSYTDSGRFDDPKCLTILWYESPVASRHRAIATRFSAAIALQSFVSSFEMFPSIKLTPSTNVLGYMRKSSLNDSRKFSSLRFSHNSVNQILFRFVWTSMFLSLLVTLSNLRELVDVAIFFLLAWFDKISKWVLLFCTLILAVFI